MNLTGTTSVVFSRYLPTRDSSHLLQLLFSWTNFQEAGRLDRGGSREQGSLHLLAKHPAPAPTFAAEFCVASYAVFAGGWECLSSYIEVAVVSAVGFGIGDGAAVGHGCWWVVGIG